MSTTASIVCCTLVNICVMTNIGYVDINKGKRKGKGKGKGKREFVYRLVVNTPLRRSGMTRVLKGSHSFTCTPRVHPLTKAELHKFPESSDVRCWFCSAVTDNKKFSYRRENAHLTSLYRALQKSFRYVEPFIRGSQVWQTDRRTDGQTAA